jgi:hypothetical protein
MGHTALDLAYWPGMEVLNVLLQARPGLLFSTLIGNLGVFEQPSVMPELLGPAFAS